MDVCTESGCTNSGVGLEQLLISAPFAAVLVAGMRWSFQFWRDKPARDRERAELERDFPDLRSRWRGKRER